MRKSFSRYFSFLLAFSLIFGQSWPGFAAPKYDKNKVKAVKKLLQSAPMSYGKFLGKKAAAEKKHKGNKLVPGVDFMNIAEKVQFILDNFEKRFDVYLNEKIALQPFTMPEEVLVHNREKVKEGENMKYEKKFLSAFKKMNIDELIKHAEESQKENVASKKDPQEIVAEAIKKLENLKKQVKFHPDLAGLKIVRGFSGENTFSFQLLKQPDFYLCVGSEGVSKKKNIPYKSLVFKKQENNENWKKGASFKLTEGKAFKKWVSIESLAHSGWFVAVEPDKFSADIGELKTYEDMKKFADAQKRTTLVLVNFVEERFHRLITTFRLTTFAPDNEFAKVLAQRDLEANPELANEVFGDLGEKMLLLQELREKLNKGFKKSGANKPQDERKAAKIKDKAKRIEKMAAETRKKLEDAVKKFKSGKGKPGFAIKPVKPDAKKLQTFKNSAKSVGEINWNTAETVLQGDFSLLDLVAYAKANGPLPGNFDTGNLPLDSIRFENAEVAAVDGRLVLIGEAEVFGKKLGEIDFSVDNTGVTCECDIEHPVQSGFSVIHDRENLEKGPKFIINLKKDESRIFLSGALKVFKKSKITFVTAKNTEVTVNITQEGFDADFIIPIFLFNFEGSLEIAFQKGKEMCSFEGVLQQTAIQAFHDKVFTGLEDKLPLPLKKYVKELFYPVSVGVSASGGEDQIMLGYTAVCVVAGQEVEWSGEVSVDNDVIVAIVQQGIDKIMAELGKVFCEVGEFGTMVWGEISSGVMTGANFVVGLSNVVGQQATRIAQQTQEFFQRGVEEAKAVFAVVTDAAEGTLEKAKEHLEAAAQKIGEEIVKFGYAVCEWLNSQIYQ